MARPSAQHLTYNKSELVPSASPSAPQTLPAAATGPRQPLSGSPPMTGPIGASPRQDPMTQQKPPSRPPSQTTNKAKPSTGPKAYKIPTKESPVPLPANFLAAMGSSPGASPSSSKLPTTQATGRLVATAVESQETQSRAATPQPTGTAATVTTPGPAGSPTRDNAGRVSTTPVPIPKFPSMTPHQAAARAAASQKMTSMASNDTDTQKAQQKGHGQGNNTLANQGQPNLALSTTNVPQIEASAASGRQEFPDVPGTESMEFMERMMANLRRVAGGGP